MIHKLIDFVKQHTCIFKAGAKVEAGVDVGDDSSEEREEDWKAMLTHEQVLVFLQLAESLLKSVNSQQSVPVKVNASIFKGLIMYEDFEVLRCALVLNNCRESDGNRSSKYYSSID